MPSGRRHPHRLECELYQTPDRVVFLTFRSRWHESLAQRETAEVIVGTMGEYAARCSLRLHAYCIMPDHVHLVVSVAAEGGDIAKWLRYAKRAVAARLGAPGMWQRSYWDRHAREHEDVAAAVEYLLANPLRAGLCESWTDWPYSWSQWHAETRGPDPGTSG